MVPKRNPRRVSARLVPILSIRFPTGHMFVFWGAVCPGGDHQPIHGLQYEGVQASSTPSLKQLTVLADSPAQELVSPTGFEPVLLP